VPEESAGMRNRRQILGSAFLAVVATALPAVACSNAAAADQNQDSSADKIVFLGTQGGPNFSEKRSETATAIIVKGRLYLVDCGYGALAGLIKAGLPPMEIDAIFLTHLHDDHTADLPAILTHVASMGRARTLTVYGPGGTHGLIEKIKGMLWINANIRIADEARDNRMLSFLRSEELGDKMRLDITQGVSLSWVENTHYSKSSDIKDTASLALRFDFGKSVVFSGDTSYSQALVSLAHEADYFICEIMDEKAMRAIFDRMKRNGALPEKNDGIWHHILNSHSTTDQVGRMAKAADVKQLILYHLLPGALQEVPDSSFREAIRKYYTGPVVVSQDGMVISLAN
jgi:ribonuclease BN (tRNA processing enzyme)